ncbi:MAG: hypothetical protein M3253_02135, partial [Chloroflexota bacterium]|nr:hypothetical protein [Chloroflexota bacterium]
ADTLVLTLGQADYGVGDVVAFRPPLDGRAGTPLVIHRIHGGSAQEGYVTRGDNMPFADAWRIAPTDIVGKQAAALPGAGLVQLARSPVMIASAAAGVATYLMLGWMGGSQSTARRPATGAPVGRRRASLVSGRARAAARRQPGCPASCHGQRFEQGVPSGSALID